MAVVAFTNQGSSSLGYVTQAELFEPSRCAVFERKWMCRTCGEVRFVEGASTTPPLRQCRWCGKEGSDWVSMEVDFKHKQDVSSCCLHPPKVAPVKVPPGVLPRGPKKALLIGLNYYSQGPDLQLSGSVGDVRAMRQFLEFQGWPTGAKHMRTLLDDRSGPLPTRDVILEALLWLVDGADAGSNLFFLFSGQGVLEESCMLTADCDVLLEDEIWDILVARLPRGARLTAIFDCFQPMTMLKMPKHYVIRDGNVHSFHQRPWNRPLDFPANVVVISATSTMQPFQESSCSRHTGAVVNAFMATLLEGGTEITYANLLAGMQRRFWKRSLKGTAPCISCLEPREFDPSAKLTLTADHSHLRSLDPGQTIVLLDLLPELPADRPEEEERDDEGDENLLHQNSSTIHQDSDAIHGHTCTSRYCCHVYQQYDVLRQPQTSLAMVPRL